MKREKFTVYFVWIVMAVATGSSTSCDSFDQTRCQLLGIEMRSFEESTGEVVPIHLYDPTWFVDSSECWTTDSDRASECGAQCEIFGEKFLEIQAEYNTRNSDDAGSPDGGSQ